MKKLINLLVGFLLFVFFCDFFCVPVWSRSYVIDDYHTDIKVNEDGSCNFTDRFIYNFDGSFNGIYFNIDYAGCGDFEDYSVSIIENGREKILRESNFGSLDTYQLSFSGKVAKFKIYSPVDSETKTFLFRYKLSAPVEKFADTAQFNRKLVPENFETVINNFGGKISFQHQANPNDLKIFAHGPLYGESKINDDGTVSLMISNLPEKTFVEANLLFPTDYVSNMKVASNEDKLKSILDKEKKLAEESNAIREKVRNDIQERQERENEAKMLVKVYIFSFAVFIVLAIIFAVKSKSEYYTEHFIGDYYRELPADYTPAEMSMLVNCKISDRDMTATLLDLFRRKIIFLEPVGARRSNFSKDDDYKITKLKEFADDNSVVEHEKFLLDFLFNEIGDSKSVYMSEIKDFARSHYEKFESQYNVWKEMLKNIADEHGFFTKQNFSSNLFAGCGNFVFFILVFVLIYKLKGDVSDGVIVSLVLSYMICFAVFIVLLASPLCTIKRGKDKQVEYEKWLAFKKFLKDFSNLSSAPIGSIVMWEHYLVYAVSLGVAKYVIKQLPLVFKNYDFKNNNDLVLLSYVYSTESFHGHGFESFGRQLHNAHNVAVREKAIAESKNSSTTGKGGGFSHGSSGGSGGGGGGGAF